MRTRQLTTLFTLLLASAAMVALAAPAAAQTHPHSFELYGGVLSLDSQAEFAADDPTWSDDTGIFGFAYGYRWSEKAGLLLEAGWADGDDLIGEILEGTKLEVDLIIVDATINYYPGGGNFYFGGGLGFVDIEAKLDLPSGRDPEASDAVISFNGGLGYEAGFGQDKKGFVRIEAKGRWVDSAAYDNVDVQGTLGFGWRWGG